MTTTDPTAPATPGETLDLAAVTTRADHYRRLCHQTGDSNAPDVVQAAHACADDVPLLLHELRRLRGERDAMIAWTATNGLAMPPVAHATDPAPATPPEHQPHDAPGGDAGHPGTPDGPAVLGRAWIDAFGGFWLPGEFADVAELEHHFGRTREVLLVRPEVGRVLEAVQAWREASKRQGVYAEHVRALAVAWDALDQPDGFYEPDEPVGAIAKAFAAGPHRRTGRSGVRVETSGVTLETERTTTTGGPDHDGLTGAPIPPLDLTDADLQATAATADQLRAELAEVRAQLRDAVEANQRWAGENADLQAQLEAMTADRNGLGVQRDRALGELRAAEASVDSWKDEVMRLRADHLLIPKAGIVGYRVRAGYVPGIMIPPGSVEMVLRGDLGSTDE